MDEQNKKAVFTACCENNLKKTTEKQIICSHVSVNKKRKQE